MRDSSLVSAFVWASLQLSWRCTLLGLNMNSVRQSCVWVCDRELGPPSPPTGHTLPHALREAGLATGDAGRAPPSATWHRPSAPSARGVRNKWPWESEQEQAHGQLEGSGRSCGKKEFMLNPDAQVQTWDTGDDITRRGNETWKEPHTEPGERCLGAGHTRSEAGGMHRRRTELPGRQAWRPADGQLWVGHGGWTSWASAAHRSERTWDGASLDMGERTGGSHRTRHVSAHPAVTMATDWGHNQHPRATPREHGRPSSYIHVTPCLPHTCCKSCGGVGAPTTCMILKPQLLKHRENHWAPSQMTAVMFQWHCVHQGLGQYLALGLLWTIGVLPGTSTSPSGLSFGKGTWVGA